jgi:hypothetical protein
MCYIVEGVLVLRTQLGRLCIAILAGSCPKFGRSQPTTAAAAPATSRSVRLQVVGREQMAIAADAGYSHGLEHTFQGKADHVSFGCSKARPRYHLQRIAPSCTGCSVVLPLFAAHPLWSCGASSRLGESPHQFTKTNRGQAIRDGP